MGDLISREAVVNAVKGLLLDGSTQLVWSSDVLDTLANVPAVDAVPEWISVKDRLPNDHEPVFVYSLVDERVTACYTTSRRWLAYDGNYVHQVTHWMPLPEPPKEG